MSAAKKKRPYHVGDLATLLLEAGEKVLRRDGVAELGLRAVTREAGVSHTAAKPHFGDLAGFRAELAAVGFRRLAAALEAHATVEPARARQVARARTYIRFAHENTELFNLMFRHELVDMRHPSLVEATARALRALAAGAPNSGAPAEGSPKTELSREAAIRLTAGWAYVHGLAVLLVEKRLHGIAKRAPGFEDLIDLADAVIDNVTLGVLS